MIKITNPSQEPQASSKAPNPDLKDMVVLCTLKINIESHNLDHGCIRDQWQYPNQDQDAIPKLGTSSILQNPKKRTQWTLMYFTPSKSRGSQNLEYWYIKGQ